MAINKIRSFEDLEVWQAAQILVSHVYQITSEFPRDEVFGLTSQMKRSALSVPANIAEGFGRYHFLDKVKFYLNSRGSLFELKSHTLIARHLGFIGKERFINLIEEIDDLSIKLNNFITATRNISRTFNPHTLPPNSP